MPRMTEKKKLWRAFSEFIRLRDSNDGYGSCISCGKMVAYPNSTGNWHAGHYYPKSVTYGSLYFDERNVQGQCCHCNTFLEGNKQGFTKGLIKKYGEEIIDELDIARLTKKKMYDFEYKELTKLYKKLIKEMKEKRGIK